VDHRPDLWFGGAAGLGDGGQRHPDRRLGLDLGDTNSLN
jgi:hypothetical protein